MENCRIQELRICIDLQQWFIVQLMMQGATILMTPEQIAQLAKMLAERRAQLRLSTNQVARHADLDTAAVWRIEHGKIAKPRPESIIAIGRALGINPIDLFTTVGWLTTDDLLDFNTHLNAGFGTGTVRAADDTEHRNGTPNDHRSYQRHDASALDHCPQPTNHCPQCPCAPKDC